MPTLIYIDGGQNKMIYLAEANIPQLIDKCFNVQCAIDFLPLMLLATRYAILFALAGEFLRHFLLLSKGKFLNDPAVLI